MPKFIDGADILVRRVNKTQRIEIMLDATGAVVSILAHRQRHIEQAGVGISPPAGLGFVGVPLLAVTPSILTAIADLETIIDTEDTFP